MSELAIRVENVSKCYRIGVRNAHRTLREALVDSAKRSVQGIRMLVHGRNGHQPEDTFWALKNVSFEVKQGEVLGIIGRNGAGKSTLLKLLSRITEPTEGRIEGYGRVGSLLEVGTGFHPELTGRENIYLNGAILGMKKAEIDRKFDEIVAFAEIEQFLDTPVKRYSSGMYVRLAFAVAAHLEPEILIVDEVLAVGDAAFQKKCLGKMDAVAQSGRTVLFVSHNMAAVEDLCSRALWLHRGRIEDEGAAGKIVSRYLQRSFVTTTSCSWADISTAPGNEKFRLHYAAVRPVSGLASEPITVRTPFAIEFSYWNLKPGAYLNVNIQLYNEQGILIFEAGPIHTPIWRPLPKGLHRDVCYVPGNLLNDGVYRVVLKAVNNHGTLVYTEEDVLIFAVQDTSDLREGWYGEWGGAVRPVLEWEREILQTETPSTDGGDQR
jgi:lipopolysaccharide transport system ATP-binding protein